MRDSRVPVWTQTSFVNGTAATNGPNRASTHKHSAASGAATDAVTGVFAADTRLIHILDPERLVQSLIKQRTTPFVRHGVSHGG
jgi:hypothetical protein